MSRTKQEYEEHLLTEEDATRISVALRQAAGAMDKRKVLLTMYGENLEAGENLRVSADKYRDLADMIAGAEAVQLKVPVPRLVLAMTPPVFVYQQNPKRGAAE